METNYSLKLAESALKDLAPDTYKYIKGTITIRSGYEDKRSVLAITRLLEIINQLNKNSIGTRKRRITRRMCDCLKNIAILSNCKPGIEIPRKQFMFGIGCNDFSIMKYWGLIQPGIRRGSWILTENGLAFVLGIPGGRYIPSEVIQLGGVRGNYKVCTNSKPVTFEDIMGL